MNQRTLIFLTVILFHINAFGQEQNDPTKYQDTVFIRSDSDWTADKINYKTDTIIFSSGMLRHILIGTTILTSTQNQQDAIAYGLFFQSVKKSNCQNRGEEVYMSQDRINTIANTDSTLAVDISIYNNCCYDFLCDISVDSMGTLNLIYNGYGNYCACNCCFGLLFNFIKPKDSKYKDIKAVMINNNRKTLKKIE